MVSPFKTLRTRALVPLALLGLSGFTARDEATISIERFFSYTRSAEQEILRIDMLPGATMEAIAFSIRGDGTLAMTATSTGQGRGVVWQQAVALGESEVHALVQSAVDAGLVTFDPSAWLEETGGSGTPVLPSSTDNAGVRFTIRLDHFAEGSEPAKESVENQFVVSALSDLTRQFPEQRAFAELQWLVALLNRHFRAALSRQQPAE